jgi:hypothetical protein
VARRNADIALALLGKSSATSWIAEEINESLASGVSVSAKDVPPASLFGADQAVVELTAPERKKREIYETTRPYTDSERLMLVLDAIDSIYLTLPAVQESALLSLAKIQRNLTEVVFMPPEETDVPATGHSFSIDAAVSARSTIAEPLSRFKSLLKSDDIS